MRLRAALFIALLAVACREKYDLQRDNELKQRLFTMRKAIDLYYQDHQAYPPSLQALVPKYLPNIPTDPLTGDTNWRLTTEESVQPSADFTTAASSASSSVIVDVHSAAPGSDRTGVPYANY